MRTAAILALCSASVFTASGVCAREAKDYSYLLVQGRLTGARDAAPVAGATVRLLGDGAVFEAITDRRGVFTFEKVEVAPYDLEIVTADGKLLQGFADPDPTDPSRVRVRLRPGKGQGKSIVLEVGGGGVAFEVPARHTNWPRLWAEIFIFGGLALGLAL